MVNDPARPVGFMRPGADRSPVAIQARYDAVADAVDPPTRAELIAFLHGNGPMRGRWFSDRYEGVPAYWWRRYLPLLEAPIPMVLHCPVCGTQHIDQATEEWPNPPHRSHLCGSCGCIWRPADVPTVGVEHVTTGSVCDTWPLTAAERAELAERINATPNLQPVLIGPPVANRLTMQDEGDLHDPPQLLPVCPNAPPGHRCTLGMGHNGPCDTVPEGAPFQGGLVERQAVLDALAHHPACCTLVRRVPHARG